MLQVNKYLFIVLLVALMGSVVLSIYFFSVKEKNAKDYATSIAKKDSSIAELQASNRAIQDEKNELNIKLSQCYSDKNQESLKRNRYEKELRYFKEDCEAELQSQNIRNRINNDNELGKLLSELGQSESLSDAGRILLPK